MLVMFRKGLMVEMTAGLEITVMRDEHMETAGGHRYLYFSRT